MLARLPACLISSSYPSVRPSIHQAVEGLMFDLSIWRCSPALKAYAASIAKMEERDAARVAEERKRCVLCYAVLCC
jgi:hypothetical protein